MWNRFVDRYPDDIYVYIYFDYIEIDKDSFLICIADVSGKGIPAALMMSNFQASLRTLVRQTTKFERIIRELNYMVLQNNNGESFITFFAAIYNKSERYFKYVNAGHNPPFFYSKNTGLIQLESGTTVLGVFHPLPFLNIGKIRELDAFSFFSGVDNTSWAKRSAVKSYFKIESFG